MSHDPISQSFLHIRFGTVNGAVMTAGSPNIQAVLNFTPADVGALVTVIGADASGKGLLVSTVASVTNSDHAVLNDNALTSTDGGSPNATIWRERGLPLDATINSDTSLTTHDTLTVSYLDELPEIVDGTPVLCSRGATANDNTDLLFGGTVDTNTQTTIPGSNLVQQDLQCVAWDQLIYKRVTGEPTSLSGSPAIDNPASGVFTNYTMGALFQYFVDNALGGDGLTLTTITGPTIPKFTVSYVSTGNAFDDLIKNASDQAVIVHWYTDPLKLIHVGMAGTTAAPWNILDSDPSSLQATIQITKDRNQLCNKAFVRSNAFITDGTEQDFVGNGTTRTFDVTDFPLALAPTITLNLAPQTVGVLGVDTGKDWYWQSGSKTITQDPSGTILTSSDHLAVLYQGFSTAIVAFTIDGSVTDRAQIEGGTGLYEIVVQTDLPGVFADQLNLAKAFAEQYSVIPRQVMITTYRPGLKVGQTIHITLARFGIDDDFVIDRVNIDTSDSVILWKVSCIGSPLINWDYRATLATLRPGGGTAQGGAGVPPIPWNAIAILPGVQTVATDVTANHRRTTVNLDGSQVTLSHFYVTAKQAPATQSFIADWEISQDNGTTWNSLLPSGTGNKIVLPVGQRVAIMTPAPFIINPIQEGWIHRVNVLQADGTASGIEIELYGGIS